MLDRIGWALWQSWAHDWLFSDQDKVVVEGVRSDAEQLSRTDVGVAAWRKFAVENARRPPAADEGPSPEAGDGGRLRTAAE